MTSWFVQHWPRHDRWSDEKNKQIQQELFDRREIGIHYQDIPSSNPLRYKKKFQRYLNKIHELAKEGGFICANFPCLKKTLIGTIRRGSLMADKGDPFLKRVKLSNARVLSPTERAVLLVGAPRRATMSRWKIVGSRLEDWVMGRKCKNWGSLQPCEQETVCQEYLRAKHGLEHLFVPFGRSMEDVDVIGMKKNGGLIVAQVTYAQSRRTITEKAWSLSTYEGDLFFFCPETDDTTTIRKDFPMLHFIDTKKIWRWLMSQPKYAKMMTK